MNPPERSWLAASALPPLAVALWLALGGTAVHAADEDKRLQAARDTLRRAQQQLQQAQAERSTLQREKAALAEERDKLAQALAEAQGRQRSAAAQQTQLGSQLARTESESAGLRAELGRETEARQALARQLETQQARAAGLQQALDEQKRVTVSVSGLLQRSVQALGEAEARNRELQALGQQALQAYLNDTPVAMRARDEPFLGLGRVALESRAEELRRAMAAQQVVR
jgi:chromosome segregation ATPase